MRRIAMLIAVGGVIPAAFGQGSTCPTCAAGGSSQELKLSVPPRAFTLDGNVLKLQARGMGSTRAWHLGVGVKPGATNTSRLFAAVFERGSGRTPVSNPRAFPDGQIATGNGIVLSASAQTAGQEFAFFVEVPRPVTLQLTVDGQLLAQVAISDSVYLLNGELTPERLRGAGQLMLRAMLGPPKQSTGVQRLGPNEYYAPPSELRKNILQFNRPPRYSSELPGPGAWVSFLVAIDTQGDVTEIGYTGDPRLRDHCRQTILGWRFRPFQHDGSTVTVKGTVRMNVGAGGDLSVPLIEAR